MGFLPPENIAPAIEENRRNLSKELGKIELKKQLSGRLNPEEMQEKFPQMFPAPPQ